MKRPDASRLLPGVHLVASAVGAGLALNKAPKTALILPTLDPLAAWLKFHFGYGLAAFVQPYVGVPFLDFLF